MYQYYQMWKLYQQIISDITTNITIAVRHTYALYFVTAWNALQYKLSVPIPIVFNINSLYGIRAGWWISEVCAYRVRLKDLYIETAVQKDFSQKSIFAREITFEKWPKKWEIVIFS